MGDHGELVNFTASHPNSWKMKSVLRENIIFYCRFFPILFYSQRIIFFACRFWPMTPGTVCWSSPLPLGSPSPRCPRSSVPSVTSTQACATARRTTRAAPPDLRKPSCVLLYTVFPSIETPFRERTKIRSQNKLLLEEIVCPNFLDKCDLCNNIVVCQMEVTLIDFTYLRRFNETP